MHALMSCVKIEGPFVVDVVAPHLVLGVDRILIASTDCDDGTDDVLAALHHAGFVQHLHHAVAADEIPQHAGYAKLRAHFGLDGVDWLAVLDVDEFLHVSLAFGRVQDLTAAAPAEVDIIALNALTFGTELGANWQPGPVCAQFTHRFGKMQTRNSAIKSLTRAPQRFRGTHNHHLVGYKGDNPLRCMRGDGTLFDLDMARPIWKQLRNIKPTETCQDWAHYNHYAGKTYDSFALRRARGRGAKPANASDPERHSEDYFAAQIGASVQDTSILVYAERVAQKMAQMLSVPAIAAAQSQTEARYGAKLDKVRRVLGLG